MGNVILWYSYSKFNNESTTGKESQPWGSIYTILFVLLLYFPIKFDIFVNHFSFISLQMHYDFESVKIKLPKALILLSEQSLWIQLNDNITKATVERTRLKSDKENNGQTRNRLIHEWVFVYTFILITSHTQK